MYSWYARSYYHIQTNTNNIRNFMGMNMHDITMTS